METHQPIDEKERSQHSTHRNHGLWMAICCAVPLGLIVLLSTLGVIGAWGYYGLILLCPVLHFFFMRNMAGKHEKNHGKREFQTHRRG